VATNEEIEEQENQPDNIENAKTLSGAREGRF